MYAKSCFLMTANAKTAAYFIQIMQNAQISVYKRLYTDNQAMSLKNEYIFAVCCKPPGIWRYEKTGNTFGK